MLPKLPKLEKHVNEMLYKRFTDAIKKNSKIASQLKRAVIHEGATATVKNEDWVDTISMQPLETSFLVRDSDIENQNFATIFQAMDEAAHDLANQSEKLLFEKINSVTSSTGNVFSGENLVETLFEMIEAMHLDFDEHGRISEGTTFVSAPSGYDKLVSAFQSIDSDAILKQRWEALIDRKRDEWRNREAARVLVQ